MFVLSRFKTKLLGTNHLITWDRTKFDNEQKLPKFMLEIMTQVSSTFLVSWILLTRIMLTERAYEFQT